MTEYSNQTLTALLNDIKKEFGKDGMVTEIRDHVKLTNGRVNKLEIWRGFMTGGIVVIIFFLGYIINYFIK